MEKKVYVELPPFTGRNVPITEIAAAMHKDAQYVRIGLQNIGKVVNEESVLYQTGLHPQKDEGTSLFGVKLDLMDLPLAVRKPAQLKAERAELDAALRSLKAEYVGLTELQEKLQDELKRRFAPKMRELREQKSYHETELRVIPQKRKSIIRYRISASSARVTAASGRMLPSGKPCRYAP